MTKLLEMSLQDFVCSFPLLALNLLANIPQSEWQDPDYIVRMSSDGTLELGYLSDSWLIK